MQRTSLRLILDCTFGLKVSVSASATPPGPPSAAPAAASPPAPTGSEFNPGGENEPLTPELVEEEAIRGDFVLRWAVVLLAFLYALTQVAETASLVHVKTGRYLLGHGVLPPRTDVFSYAAADRVWVNLSWGFDLLLGGVYALSGWGGITLVKAVLAALTFGLVVHTSRRTAPTWWSAVCAAATVLAVHERFVALPGLITLLGLAATLFILEGNRGLTTAAASSRRYWTLIPLFFLWSNLDSRMFFGLALLVLYGLGDLLGKLLKTGESLDASAKRPFWMAVGGSFAATLVHPFLWRPLLAPATVYGIEYPTFREYLNKVFEGKLPLNQVVSLMPVWTDRFWDAPNLAVWCSVGVITVCLIMLILNAGRLEFSHALVWLGITGLGMCAGQDLALAALVSCVLAALNGQVWYQADSPLVYKIDTWPLLFSRGGRALTVVSLAALAFFGGTGKLRSTTGRTGIGLDYSLGANLRGLEAQLEDSFDNRPFNSALQQGDMLIWLDQQVFVDSRIPLFAGKGDKNLLDEHWEAKLSLESTTRNIAEKPKWKTTLDKYKLTHVLPRLTGERPEYSLMAALLQGAQTWHPASLGGATLVAYRLDVKDPELTKYLKTRRLDLVQAAFQRDPVLFTLDTAGKEVERPLEQMTHESWPRSPSFYEQYFWSKRREVPIEVQEALHLVRLAPLTPFADALAFLGIRRAQQGLKVNPSSTDGYLALGLAYQLLYANEGPLMAPSSPQAPSSIRYYQAVAAFNLALTADPENMAAHQALLSMYEGPQLRTMAQQGQRNSQFAARPDLAARELKAIQASLLANLTPTTEQRQLRAEIKSQLATYDQLLATVNRKLGEMKAQANHNTLQSAVSVLELGLYQTAGQIIEDDAELRSSPVAHQLLAVVHLETGPVESAAEFMRDINTSNPQAASLLRPVAVAHLANGEYAAATTKMVAAAENYETQLVNSLLSSSFLHPSAGGPWPSGVTQTTEAFFYNYPSVIGDLWLNSGLVQLEAGRFKDAEKSLREALRTNPSAPYRELVGRYLFLMTGKLDIEMLPPSELIPVEFEPEPAG